MKEEKERNGEREQCMGEVKGRKVGKKKVAAMKHRE